MDTLLRLRDSVLFASLAPTFPWQDEDESTVLLCKRHWIAFARYLPIPLLLLLAFAVASWLLRQAGLLTALPGTLLFALALPSVVTVWLYLDWQNDFYLVTTERVLHQEKVVLLYQTWEEAPLSKITNTTVTRDFVGSMLNFGSLHIQTASIRGSMVLDYLPHPEEVQRAIYEQASRLGAEIQPTPRQSIHQALLTQLGGAQGTASSPRVSSQGEPAHARQRHSQLHLQPSEQSHLIWRKHWTFLVRRSLTPAILLVIATGLLMLSLFGIPASLRLAVFLATLVLWLVSLVWLWWRVVDWSNDLYVLTDSLIIDIESKPLFLSEERRQATLDMIQNVTLHQEGVFATMFNYGDVVIHTAGVSGEFTFAGVSDPTRVQREVFRRVDVHREEKQRRERLGEQAEISEWFGVYHQMRDTPDSSGC